MKELPELLQAFFTERLLRQRQASPHTIASYRDAFRLLLQFCQRQRSRQPSRLSLQDLNPAFITDFLQDLESTRGVGPRTRNARLAAIHSFFHYVALTEPSHSDLAQKVLAIPSKRFERRPIEYLTADEVATLLRSPARDSWGGRRDYTLLLTAVQTGLRVSELVGLKCRDVQLGHGAHVRCRGKGRKERCTPLRKDVANALRLWLRECQGDPSAPLFPNARGGCLTRDGVEYLLAKHLAQARRHCPSLRRKRVSAHVLRHTAAMNLLEHGVDSSVIALWLGHESVETTQVYLHADLALKQRALAKTNPQSLSGERYRPDDQLLAFLKGL